MLRNLIRLAVFLLIANALYRFVPVYMHHYQFKDAVAEAAKFSKDRSDVEIIDRVMVLAERYQIPIDREAVQVTPRQADDLHQRRVRRGDRVGALATSAGMPFNVVGRGLARAAAQRADRRSAACELNSERAAAAPIAPSARSSAAIVSPTRATYVAVVQAREVDLDVQPRAPSGREQELERHADVARGVRVAEPGNDGRRFDAPRPHRRITSSGVSAAAVQRRPESGGAARSSLRPMPWAGGRPRSTAS